MVFVSAMATTEAMPDIFSTTTAPIPLEDWPLAVRIAVPIISILSFIAVQVIVLFVKDPGYKKRIPFAEDPEFQPVLTTPTTERTVPEKAILTPTLPKSSSTSCHIQSREENRKARSGRRTMSESDVLPLETPRNSETQCYLQGVLRCPMGRPRLASTSSSTGTSEEGAAHGPTFQLSFGRKRRMRSQSTGEVGSNSPGLLENYRMTSGGNLDANQITISSIQEENEFGSRDPYNEEDRRQAAQRKEETRF